MERDRNAALTIRAASRGVVDFSQADLRDVQWWRRSNLLIRAMAQDDERHVVDAAFRLQLALLANGSLNEESFKGAKENSRALLDQMHRALLPWSDPDREAQSELQGLYETYKRLVGDPADPAFIARTDAEAIALFNKKPEAAGEAEEARIERLRVARDNRHKAARR